jgi:hypothetical protein
VQPASHTPTGATPASSPSPAVAPTPSGPTSRSRARRRSSTTRHLVVRNQFEFNVVWNSTTHLVRLQRPTVDEHRFFDIVQAFVPDPRSVVVDFQDDPLSFT